MDPTAERYSKGYYRIIDHDGLWKAQKMCGVIQEISDKKKIQTYADVGCGQVSVLNQLRILLIRQGFPLRRVCGYDIAPFPEGAYSKYRELELRQMDFLSDKTCFDLITLMDVLEHVGGPKEFLAEVGSRARYVALHVPLDDRLSVLLANQYNVRIQKVGHISFWNPSTALNLVTAAGLLPLFCRFTPGFLAPSGREKPMQIVALPVRLFFWMISPGLAAKTVGGISMAILCRGKMAR